MAFNSIHVDTTAARVFEVLSDPESYGHWVVGSSQIRDVDGPFPAVGSLFHHTQGVGPVGIKDTTSVIESKPGERLVLEVRGRPLMVASVELDLVPDGNGGTEVKMTETPIRGFVGRFRNVVFDKMIELRNGQSLRRLRRLAEGPS
jgi:uncharacterized protein YndB with AHSA1/START domain